MLSSPNFNNLLFLMLAKSIAMPYQLPDCTITYSAITTHKPVVPVRGPIGLNGGMNFYAYTPIPLAWIDSLGLIKLYRAMTLANIKK